MMKTKPILYGAIAGDIIGSRLEYSGWKSTEFDLFTPESHFTDDSILTVAVADAIVNQRSYQDSLWTYANRFPSADYGDMFRRWMASDEPKPYNSFGNGSAMRVSPVGWAYNRADEVLYQAKMSALPTHDHPEGIKGAQAVAYAIYLARSQASKTEIRDALKEHFAYDLDRPLTSIRGEYQYDVTCQGSVPESVIAFLESDDFTSAVRLAVSLGGDIDTMACIAGSIAEAFYGCVPDSIRVEVINRLPEDWIGVLNGFNERYH